eukprot:TRINITY_DN1386_c0_g2_i1.p1 TRINITY_DN1386_c0_g2~~TRINITY_DN1386_c0_g2_i1.p1  ORF type:complete len:344 (-),score=117.02 TRINITY_DN1386_c0_g2_i1:176-1207(-)
MPPKKKGKGGKKGGKGKGDAKSGEDVKTPEEILDELLKKYKKACADVGADTIDDFLKIIKESKDAEDGPILFSKVVLSRPILTAQLTPMLEVLSAYEPLRQLLFWRSHVGDDGVHVLSEFMKQDQRVQLLDLMDNGITDLGCLFIESFLGGGSRVNSTLKSIVLDFNVIGNEGVFHLVRALRTGEAVVESLSLRFCGIGAVGGAELGGLLSVYDKLLDIDLQGNEMLPEGVIDLVNPIPKSKLKVIGLRETSFAHNDEAISKLCDAMLESETLEKVDLQYNSMSHESAERIASVAEKKKNVSIVVNETIDPLLFGSIVTLKAGKAAKGKKGGKGKKKGKKKKK